MDISDKLKIESEYWNEFWKNSKYESPSSEILDNLIKKSLFFPKFYDCVKLYKNVIKDRANVLELGAGHGWASCIFKSLYPNSFIFTTDLSIDALKSLKKWETILKVKIDSYFASSSSEINLENSSIDYIFCFESAHHFRDHYSTIVELKRVLKKGGKAFYFNEPVCNKFIYPLAFWLTNKRSFADINSPSPEDLLIPSKLRKYCKRNGLSFEINYYLKTSGRGPIPTIYYFVLGLVPFLKYLLPSCANIIISKN